MDIVGFWVTEPLVNTQMSEARKFELRASNKFETAGGFDVALRLLIGNH